MKRIVLAALLAIASSAMPAAVAGPVDVGAFVRKDHFDDIKISPTGEYYAATVRGEDRTGLVIINRAEGKVTAQVSGTRNTVVDDFWWANSERIVASMAEKFGSLDRPLGTGELYAVSADGSKSEMLVGQRLQGSGPGSRIDRKKVERVWADMVNALPNDDRHVVIAVGPFTAEPYTRAERMDVYTGRRVPIARAPVRRANFSTDNRGEVRFAHGAGIDNMSKLYYRNGKGDDWQLISDEGETGLDQRVIGFSADDNTAYLRAEQADGPDAIIALDLSDMSRRQVLRDEVADPARIIYRSRTRIPVGAFFANGKPRTAFIDDDEPEARLYRSLEAAFDGQAVRITSRTTDGNLALLQVFSDRNPGDFYVFDIAAKKADHLLSRREWFDPDGMGEMRPVTFKARDGLSLHGYLTLPNGSGGSSLPMVVMPHGGPFGIQDTWGFDTNAQLLAGAGYAVLQVNFRGSGGFGKAFRAAGAKQWGRAMQDDLTDATRWAIQQGIADSGRICIFGASYGAYASLMGVAKEPGLYRCAAGYVGVYDLPTMHVHGDIQERRSGGTYLKEWVGERDEVAEVSPARLADRIKVPVFLAAGGEDQRTPIKHSEMMERALKKEGVPVETLYYKTEGHGFYKEEHQREFYTQLLAFLSRNLGGDVATTSSGGAAAGD
ncbi:alpha/beta hydrolase family protein [Marilutibacter alkalisoli]|uniref:S9 family peptidase n=1 Tax=Marilutibacter alkalisoli TaxID=2591633 RepID=A0A514BPU4_9GAMM|nr:S9 family peptidase [Lysobacter alkalisoli]QDH69398.1 S9 family peptidase [Lysobacter alkalisoli]